MVKVLEGEERERVKAKLDELVAEYEQNVHGIQVRQVANGYKFSTKAEHHEILRKYVKSLKAPVRLSKPALETLAVIAYRQPVTVPEIEEIRGVDSGGVIHTLLEKKLVVTSGRKSVVGRPILYRTSKDFLVHFGLKDVGELPSLKEFEELAKRALGSDWAGEGAPAASGEPVPTTGEAGSAPAVATEAIAAPSAEAGPSAGEGASEIPQQPLLPTAEESTSLASKATPEAALAAPTEAGAASVDVTAETPQEASAPVAAEDTPLENPAATETTIAIREESAAMGVEATPETPQEAPAAVAEKPSPLEAPAPTDSEPGAEEVGAVSGEETLAPPQGPVPPAAEETAAPEAPAATPSDSSATEPSAQSEETASARESTPNPGDPEPGC